MPVNNNDDFDFTHPDPRRRTPFYGLIPVVPPTSWEFPPITPQTSPESLRWLAELQLRRVQGPEALKDVRLPHYLPIETPDAPWTFTEATWFRSIRTLTLRSPPKLPPSAPSSPSFPSTPSSPPPSSKPLLPTPPPPILSPLPITPPAVNLETPSPPSPPPAESQDPVPLSKAQREQLCRDLFGESPEKENEEPPPTVRSQVSAVPNPREKRASRDPAEASPGKKVRHSRARIRTDHHLPAGTVELRHYRPRPRSRYLPITPRSPSSSYYRRRTR